MLKSIVGSADKESTASWSWFGGLVVAEVRYKEAQAPPSHSRAVTSEPVTLPCAGLSESCNVTSLDRGAAVQTPGSGVCDGAPPPPHAGENPEARTTIQMRRR
jgi:hypothetical protein